MAVQKSAQGGVSMLLDKLKKLLRRDETFALEGVRSFMRLENERATIDGRAANAAFETCYKEIVEPLLTAHGFIKWSTRGFVRLNSLDVLEWVNFQKERSGSKTFTVNVHLLPLYVPQELMQTEFRVRLGELICGRDVWWDFADEKIARISFNNVTRAIEKFVFSWLGTWQDEAAIKARLIREKRYAEWLRAIDDHSDRLEIMRENIAALHLPKSLLADRRP